MMTVAELRKMLEQYPDDTLVYTYGDYWVPSIYSAESLELVHKDDFSWDIQEEPAVSRVLLLA